MNFTIQISNEKLAVALYKLSNKERDVILLRYFQSMSDQEIAELYHVSRSAIYRRRSMIADISNLSKGVKTQ